MLQFTLFLEQLITPAATLIHRYSAKDALYNLQVGPDSLKDNKSLVAVTQACSKGEAAPSSIGLPTQGVAEDGLASGSFTAATSIFDSTCHRLHGTFPKLR
jgi:hypothetical protein